MTLLANLSGPRDLRKMNDLARADLLLTMGDLLSAEELKQFKAALERKRGQQAARNESGGPSGAAKIHGEHGAAGGTPEDGTRLYDRAESPIHSLTSLESFD